MSTIEAKRLENPSEFGDLIRQNDGHRFTNARSGEDVAFYGCWLDGQPAGLAALGPEEEGVGRLRRFFVAPPFRGRSVGPTLLRTVVDDATSDYMTLVLSTTCPIESRFYAIHGFHRSSKEGATHEMTLVGA